MLNLPLSLRVSRLSLNVNKRSRIPPIKSTLPLNITMAPGVTTLKQPLAIRPDYIATHSTSIRVNQHRTSISGGDYTISKLPNNNEATNNQEPEDLFTVTGHVKSLSQRRHFRDASGLPLFELSRKKTGVTWFVSLPSAKSDDECIATIAPRMSALKDKGDVYVANAAAGGAEVRLEVRGQDVWKLRTNVYLDGKVVVTAKRTDKLVRCIPGMRPEWHVDVAEGMDLSLVGASLCIRGIDVDIDGFAGFCLCGLVGGGVALE